MTGYTRVLDFFKSVARIIFGSTLPGFMARVLGLTAAIVPAYFAYIQYLKEPNPTMLFKGPVVMLYNSKEQTLEVSFEVTITNQGYGDEIINKYGARLVNHALPPVQNFIPFETESIVFKDNNQPLPATFVIPKEITKVLTCTLKHRFGDLSKKVIMTPGTAHLCVNVFDERGRHFSHEFCLQTDGDLMTPKGTNRQQFDTTNCETKKCSQ